LSAKFHNEANSVKLNLSGRLQFLIPSVLLLLSLLLPALVAAQVPLIQITNNGGVAYQKVVQVPYAPQTAGDLNLVVVGWNDISSTIASVTDTAGNTYVLAAGTVSTPLPTGNNANPAGVSQAIYYAKNIVGGANTVIVTFNSATAAQDIRILEYGTAGGGFDLVAPLDTSIGASATAGPASSGPATTNSANDLIFGAGTITSGFTSVVKACGTGCVMYGEPTGSGINNFGDIVEDALVSAAGPYNAAANFADGAAVMQMVALRLAGQTIPSFPTTATSVLPATSPEAGGVPITITGTGFATGATVVFNNGAGVTASAVNCSVASGTTITCLTPSFTTAGTTTVVVTNVDGSATTPLAFTYTPSTPFSTAGTGAISPDGGSTNGGTFVTITGSDFAAGAVVRIGGVPAYKVQVVNSTTIQAILPAGSAGNPSVNVFNPSGANGAVPGGYAYSTGAGINFIQGAYATAASGTNQPVTFNLPQTAGDLNVVVAGWGDTTASVTSVTDTAGNTYAVAAPAVAGTNLTQVIYYAKNINASASNTVTVNFNQSAAFPDVRIVEYNGLDTVNPLDAGGGAFGAGTAMDSGPITLTSAGDLFIGAGDVGDVITSPGNGFATAILTNYGNNVEHSFPNGAGAFDATATQGDDDAWVMQGVGFRQPAGAIPGFTVDASALSPVSVAPGGSATSTITVTATDGFTGSVQLTCPATGLPTGVACNFATNPVIVGASPATSLLTISTTASTPAGSTPIAITGTSGSVVSSAPVTLVVVAAGSGNFTLTATPSSQTVAPGAAGTSTIAVVPTGGFTDTVNLTCSITTSASPAPVCSVTATATPSTSATLTVSTTAATAAVRHSSNIFYAMFLPIGGMTLLGVGFGSRRKKVLGVLLVFLMVSGLLFLVACGGGSSSGGGGGGGTPGTPAGNYTVTVTGTSGSLTAQTTTFTLTVQ
jgi:IPT/TIG domain